MSGQVHGADPSPIKDHVTVGDSGNLTIVSLNARSIANKFLDLKVEVLEALNFPSIVCLTETWLHDGIPNSFFPYENLYHIFRRDRVDRPGGGVCIMIKKMAKVSPFGNCGRWRL